MKRFRDEETKRMLELMLLYVNNRSYGGEEVTDEIETSKQLISELQKKWVESTKGVVWTSGNKSFVVHWKNSISSVLLTDPVARHFTADLTETINGKKTIHSYDSSVRMTNHKFFMIQKSEGSRDFAYLVGEFKNNYQSVNLWRMTPEKNPQQMFSLTPFMRLESNSRAISVVSTTKPSVRRALVMSETSSKPKRISSRSRSVSSRKRA